MSIAAAATGGWLDAEVSQQFGRCQYFVIVDFEKLRFEPFSNPASTMAGGMGIRAHDPFTERGIDVVVGVQLGTPKQAVQAYLKGTLSAGVKPL